MQSNIQSHSTILVELKKTNLFSDFSEHQLNDILHLTKRETLNSGDMLISPGTVPTDFYMIHFGSVRIHLDGPQGKSESSSVIGTGGLLGMIGVATSEPWMISAEALEHTELVVFPLADLDRYFSAHAESALKFYRALSRHLGHSMRNSLLELVRLRESSAIEKHLRILT
jgi:CRP-like cAMP-binding protein